MCLILFAWQSHPQYKLLVAANRDEFYERPADTAHFWKDAPHILAGRDLEQGGAWLGITQQGRFAALTNVRNPTAPIGEKSRGLLVSEYLRGDATPQQFLEKLRHVTSHYSPFNFLAGDNDTLYYSNSDGDIRVLPPGVYGLSNAALDTPWPKVTSGKEALHEAMQTDKTNPEYLFTILASDEPAEDDELPDTGIGIQMEKPLSSRFISLPTYGTRCSTVLLQTHNGETRFLEKRFDDTGKETGVTDYSLRIEKASK